MESYRFFSSSLDSLVKTLVDNSHKTMRNLNEEIVDSDEILNIVNKIGEKNETIKDLGKDYAEEKTEIEEALLNYMGENDLKLLNSEFTDKWNFST